MLNHKVFLIIRMSFFTLIYSGLINHCLIIISFNKLSKIFQLPHLNFFFDSILVNLSE